MSPCPHCTSPNTTKHGKPRGRQRWKCKGCGRTHTENAKPVGGQKVAEPATGAERSRKHYASLSDEAKAARNRKVNKRKKGRMNKYHLSANIGDGAREGRQLTADDTPESLDAQYGEGNWELKTEPPSPSVRTRAQAVMDIIEVIKEQ